MKCKDCETTVKKVNKDGICAACSRRKSQRKYAGKKYIPLKDLKGTWQYDLAMRKRAESINKNSKDNKENDKKLNDIGEESTKNKFFLQVSKDVDKSFKEEKLTKEYLDFNLENFIESFYSLMQEDNYIADAKKAEEIFNKTSIDFIHMIENCSWEDKEIQNIVYQEKALLELRRPTKTMLCYYKIIEPVVEYLKKDSQFMETFENSRIEFIKSKGKIEKGEYFPRQTHLMTKDKLKNYNCSVMCYNLYGNQGLQELKANGGIWAKDENEARKVFLKFINSSFPTITYNSDDIKIELNEEF